MPHMYMLTAHLNCADVIAPGLRPQSLHLHTTPRYLCILHSVILRIPAISLQFNADFARQIL